MIVPSFQQGPYIRSCIESIISQANVQVEVLVFDSESSDETAELLKEFENRAEVVVERDLGQAHAINKGLNRATGDFIGIVNSDDLLQPHALHEVAARMTQADAPTWVVGQCHRVDESDQPLGMLWTAPIT